MIDYGLQGRVALVTGGGGGIGRASALAFARSGASVVVSDVDDGQGSETVHLIRSRGGNAIYSRCDVSDPAQVQGMVASAVDTFGRLDCAFNNAGINSIMLDEYDDEVWSRAISVNLTGVMMCMREAAAVMVKQGGGAIVNTASINGVVGNPGQPAYTAAKHGVVGLTRHGALRWASSGIRVNAVCPGVIDTPMTEQVAADPALRAMIEGMTPIGRMGRAEEVAEAVVWLCSDAASFVTGHPLLVDGGATAI
ncbi:SDR family oxidoreductase [Novosphingobium sp. P6W]|uniref:SDR family oxidoreductase n=1 Tax=Novosphingobium sp. P6W TaxID=1609758 RepID=UPI0005C31A64|nr:SDR family oxidoreductase [Novosphingobium sp. P6W]AXB80256.1 SDR family NAD(P)-dependent oxidoreductase [Novosphingobium sp. P6W]KIS31593.1 short-chain dehydrogenase [Novosphingobium sp. P6W]